MASLARFTKARRALREKRMLKNRNRKARRKIAKGDTTLVVVDRLLAEFRAK